MVIFPMRGDKPTCDISLQRLIHYGKQVMFRVQGEPHSVPSGGTSLDLCVESSFMDCLYLLVQPLAQLLVLLLTLMLTLAEEPACHRSQD